MYRPLSPCPSCQRHVLASAAACPFCDATLEARELSMPALPRMSRAAAAVVGASLALAACGGGKTEPADPVDPTVKPQPAPKPDAKPAPDPKPAPKPDASTPPPDPGGDRALYGAPPEPISIKPGPDDPGGMMAKYGAPPPPERLKPKTK